MGFRTSFLVLMILTNIACAIETDFICPALTVTCICNEGEKVLDLNTFFENNSNSHGARCIPEVSPYKACFEINCSDVLIPYGPNQGVPLWRTESGKVEALRPTIYTLPLSNDALTSSYNHGNRHRHVRQTEACPTFDVDNAFLKCSEWPNYLDCNLKCNAGYAFEDSNKTYHSVDIHCRKSENIWKPFNYSEHNSDCKPYILCNPEDIVMVSPGNIKCYKQQSGPFYCDIECFDHGIFEATSLQRYECLEDAFGGSLPHCVDYKYSRAKLVKRPDDEAGLTSTLPKTPEQAGDPQTALPENRKRSGRLQNPRRKQVKFSTESSNSLPRI